MEIERSVNTNMNKSWIYKLDRVAEGFERLLYVITAILLAVMVLSVVYGVVGRAFFQLSVAWTVEFSEYLMVYITFLAAAWILKRDGHVQVDIILNLVSKNMKGNMLRVGYALATVGCALLFYYSAAVTIDHFQRGVVMYNIMKLPKYLVLWPIPVGCLFLTLRCFLKMMTAKEETAE